VTEVLVVGAGPAGSLAAWHLAQAGVRVQLIDRSSFPRNKLCGDTLNPGALAILDRLDRVRSGADGPATLGGLVRGRALAIAGMMVTGPGGTQVVADYPRALRGASITRRDLDLLLAGAAAEAGAVFDTGVTAHAPIVSNNRVVGVRVRAGGRDLELRARVVIAAEGRASRVAGALGLSRFARAPRRWAYGAYFGGVAGLTARGEMHVRGGGYLGVAPLPGALANVCVVHESPRGAPAPKLDQRQVIADAIARNGVLRDRFGSAEQVSDVVVLGPLSVEASAAGMPGLLLAGDAAGFVDPMTGDGMRFALRGGELAAEAALRELRTGEPAHEGLAADRRREFSPKWRLNRALRALVGSSAGVALAACIARRWPAPVEYLVGAAGDIRLAAENHRGAEKGHMV
jgi:flavin-dependent dehydrogenase